MTYDINWLTDKFDRGERIEYIFFWGHSSKDENEVGKFVFSQWYHAPFTIDGVEYKTAEHYMMAKKASLFNDDQSVERILKADKPGEVKDIGRRIQNFDEQLWNKEKFRIVVEGSTEKFGQNIRLKDFLLATKRKVLVEASPTDVIWGIGLAQDAKQIEDPHTWRGQNLLGFALMEAREALSQL